MARQEHPRYASMEFPEWEYIEFPMMVYPGSKDGGKTPDRIPSKPGKFLQDPVTVNNEDELRAALAGGDTLVKDDTTSAMRVKTPEDERLELVAEVERLGIQYDKRWGTARLQAALDEHNAEPVV